MCGAVVAGGSSDLGLAVGDLGHGGRSGLWFGLWLWGDDGGRRLRSWGRSLRLTVRDLGAGGGWWGSGAWSGSLRLAIGDLSDWG